MIFIRPWVLLLILAPLIFQLWRKHQNRSTPWTKWVDKRLLSALLIKDATAKTS